VEVVASLSQGRTAAAQCGFFTHKSVPVIFEPPCTSGQTTDDNIKRRMHFACSITKATNAHSEFPITIAFSLQQMVERTRLHVPRNVCTKL